MDTNTLIQAELNRIEEEAARQSSLLLAVQDDYVAAHALVDLLKAHGAADELEVSPAYHYKPARIHLYPTVGKDSDTVDAIERSGLTIDGVSKGFSPDVTHITIRGYASVYLFVHRSAMEWQVAA